MTLEPSIIFATQNVREPNLRQSQESQYQTRDSFNIQIVFMETLVKRVGDNDYNRTICHILSHITQFDIEVIEDHESCVR